MREKINGLVQGRREEGKKGTESKEGPLGTGAGAGGTFEKQKKKNKAHQTQTDRVNFAVTPCDPLILAAEACSVTSNGPSRPSTETRRKRHIFVLRGGALSAIIFPLRSPERAQDKGALVFHVSNPVHLSLGQERRPTCPLSDCLKHKQMRIQNGLKIHPPILCFLEAPLMPCALFLAPC